VADIIGARRACAVAMISSVRCPANNAGRAEVGMAELALDDVERHALRGRVRRRGRGAADAAQSAAAHRHGRGSRRNSARSPALDQDRPRVGPSMMQNSGPAGSSTRCPSQGHSCSQPQPSMPISRRRPPLPRRTSSHPSRDGHGISSQSHGGQSPPLYHRRAPPRAASTSRVASAMRKPAARRPGARSSAAGISPLSQRRLFVVLRNVSGGF
jgi:hypothetical protein